MCWRISTPFSGVSGIPATVAEPKSGRAGSRASAPSWSCRRRSAQGTRRPRRVPPPRRHRRRRCGRRTASTTDRPRALERRSHQPTTASRPGRSPRRHHARSPTGCFAASDILAAPARAGASVVASTTAIPTGTRGDDREGEWHLAVQPLADSKGQVAVRRLGAAPLGAQFCHCHPSWDRSVSP